jgi:chemotaxis response regulator CheB
MSTKILFVESDGLAFQVRECIAKAIANLPSFEMIHAIDATEALSHIELSQPDVIVIDSEEAEECELLIDSLSAIHPPVIVQTNSASKAKGHDADLNITYLEKNDSLEGIHQTLLIASSLAEKNSQKETNVIH